MSPLIFDLTLSTLYSIILGVLRSSNPPYRKTFMQSDKINWHKLAIAEKKNWHKLHN